jgi:DNA gyrase subunit A
MKKKDNKTENKPTENKAHIAGAGLIREEVITDTLETNFMPYAMSVILSRAIPEIDGFKPSHRKLLYTMYKMSLLGGARTKSANIVGATMRLNPHGDASIYETMVRLTKGNESLLHPFIDSKGNFGKAYSKNMAYAAPRYTEAKLEKLCEELFRDIDKETVDFVDNYDSTTTEPTLLPVTFPNILCNPNSGIAVGMASNICSFNLIEICNTTIELINDPDHNVADTIQAPDFVGGASVVYDRKALDDVLNTGKGSLRVRAKYKYDKKNNCIDITEIPPTTTSEAIIDKVIDLVKTNKVKEITDIRDETDKTGLKITIDLKRATDPDDLMRKLYKMTPLEDNFACNFNVLIGGMPKVMGVQEILLEWIAFRTECIKRRVSFELGKAKDKLHLLLGLQKILLDIDKAVKIVRETEEEADVVPNLMIGFGIDNIQAEYVAEIKLRHLNREYILKRLADIEQLEKDIAEMESILKTKSKQKKIIVDELKNVMKKYGKGRHTDILYIDEEEEIDEEELIPDYPVHLFYTSEGYFKKITPQSLRMSGEHKLKEGDEIIIEIESTNAVELLFFTDRQQVYKAKASDFDDTKTSVMGDYIPSKLEFDPDEKSIFMAVTSDYVGYMLFFGENGKVVKVDLDAYATKTNRKKLVNAYTDKYPIVQIAQIREDTEFRLTSSNGRVLLFNTGAISTKATKNSQGVAVMTQKKNYRLISAVEYKEGSFANPRRYRTKNLPAAGATLSSEDAGEQLSFE